MATKDERLASTPLAELREELERSLELVRIERAARGPRQWTSWLPPKLEARALATGVEWPTELMRELVEGETVRKRVTLSDLNLAMFDKMVEEVRASEARAANEAGDEPEPKRQRIDEPPAAEEGAAGVSEAAAEAMQVLWKMDFGAEWANPFRMRLTREACDAIGMTDYYDVVDQPMDLALIREKLQRDEYADDAALRRDIVLIATNAAKYHLADSPILDFANDLVRTFDAHVANAAVGL